MGWPCTPIGKYIITRTTQKPSSRFGNDVNIYLHVSWSGCMYVHACFQHGWWIPLANSLWSSSGGGRRRRRTTGPLNIFFSLFSPLLAKLRGFGLGLGARLAQLVGARRWSQPRRGPFACTGRDKKYIFLSLSISLSHLSLCLFFLSICLIQHRQKSLLPSSLSSNPKPTTRTSPGSKSLPKYAKLTTCHSSTH